MLFEKMNMKTIKEKTPVKDRIKVKMIEVTSMSY